MVILNTNAEEQDTTWCLTNCVLELLCNYGDEEAKHLSLHAVQSDFFTALGNWQKKKSVLNPVFAKSTFGLFMEKNPYFVGHQFSQIIYYIEANLLLQQKKTLSNLKPKFLGQWWRYRTKVAFFAFPSCVCLLVFLVFLWKFCFFSVEPEILHSDSNKHKATIEYSSKSWKRAMNQI